jgi:hypothetical protein
MELQNDITKRVRAVIATLKETPEACCRRACLQRLLTQNEAAVQVFLEEWYGLEKSHQAVALRVMIRLWSHWSAQTVRGTPRRQPRVAVSDPLLGSMCRRAFARLVGIADSTLARHTAAVHASEGRFGPPPHQNTGQAGHHQIAPEARQEVVAFLMDIAAAVGEESPGRHRLRDEEDGPPEAEKAKETPVIFLPAMYTLRLLYRLYTKQVERRNLPAGYHVSWGTFGRLFHASELAWLRLRTARDDMCEICLRYRGKMAQLMGLQETESVLKELGETSRIFVQHRDLAMRARRVYRRECKQAQNGARAIWQAAQQGAGQTRLQGLLAEYEAHYSVDFAQNLWLPQLADTPGPFYFLSLRSVLLFGIVDDGGLGTPRQTNMLYDQTTAGKGSSEVVSMLSRFLSKERSPRYAARRVAFHADNCVGQNKNSTLVHFLLWCIATHVLDHVEVKFLVKGHTKFSPDGGFGMIKKHYRRATLYTIDQVAQAINQSTEETRRNAAVVLGKEAFGEWKTALRSYFAPLKGISACAAFRFDATYALGEVHVQEYNDDTWQSIHLLHDSLTPADVLDEVQFRRLPEHLPPVASPSIQAKKQWDLYEKVRPYVPAEYQDIICPQPNVSKNTHTQKEEIKVFTGKHS